MDVGTFIDCIKRRAVIHGDSTPVEIMHLHHFEGGATEEEISEDGIYLKGQILWIEVTDIVKEDLS